MNKSRNYTLTFIVMALFLTLTGCDSKEKEPESSGSDLLTVDTSEIKGTPVTDNSFADFDLSYNVQKGNTYLYKLTQVIEESKSFITDTMQSVKIQQQITHRIQVVINELESDKTMEATFNVDEIGVVGQMDKESFKFLSTDKKIDSVKDKRFFEYIALLNNPFNARIDKNGNIIEIYRVTKIIDKFLELHNKKDSISSEDKQLLIQDVTEGRLRPIIMQIFRKLPEQKVAIDSSWYFKQSPVNLQIFALQNTQGFKLSAFEKVQDQTFAVIEASLISKTELSPEAKANGISMKNTGYTGNGKLHFNIKLGIFQKTKTTTTFNLELERDAPKGAPFSKVKSKETTRTLNLLELIN